MDTFRLPDQTHIANISLRVTDSQTAMDFYCKLLGFLVTDRTGSRVSLAASRKKPPMILLTEDPNAAPKPRRSPGLYHMAIRLPDRLELARMFQRLNEAGWPLQGASDHLVSEAIYLADPEGNGIEIYADRPRDQWHYEDDTISMSTEPLDIGSLLAELERDEREVSGISPTTDVGHVHLQVSELARSEEFYHSLLGFEVTQRGYPGALFLSAGGYHHHLGLNTWASRGAPPPPSNAVGLISLAIAAPDEVTWRALRDRLTTAGLHVEDRRDVASQRSMLVRDPDSIAVEITAPSTGV